MPPISPLAKSKTLQLKPTERNPCSRAFYYGCWVNIASGSAFGHGPKLVGTVGLWHWQVQPRIWQVDLPFVVSDIGSLHQKLSCLQSSFHKLRELLAVYLNKVINTNGTNKVHCRKGFGPSGETEILANLWRTGTSVFACDRAPNVSVLKHSTPVCRKGAHSKSLKTRPFKRSDKRVPDSRCSTVPYAFAVTIPNTPMRFFLNLWSNIAKGVSLCETQNISYEKQQDNLLCTSCWWRLQTSLYTELHALCLFKCTVWLKLALCCITLQVAILETNSKM